jgi:hypothetical protein
MKNKGELTSGILKVVFLVVVVLGFYLLNEAMNAPKEPPALTMEQATKNAEEAIRNMKKY